jgi:hypothetical protein
MIKTLFSELVIMILEFVDDESVLAFAATCSYFKEMLESTDWVK